MTAPIPPAYEDYDRSDIISACQLFGGDLDRLSVLPGGVTGRQLLWAISGNESSFGKNCRPRYEPAYDVGGIYYLANRANLITYGPDAAFSYGPWQILFANVKGFSPKALTTSLTNAAVATAGHLAKQLLRFKPANLKQIASIWNGGNPHAILNLPRVQQYAADLENNYAVPMAVPSST